MTKHPNLTTAMTPFPYSVQRDTPLTQAQQLMEQHNVHHLPVTEEHAVVGVITGQDIKSALYQSSDPGRLGELKVQDIYVADPYVVSIDEPFDNVLLTMADRHIGSAVVTKGGKLAGVFTALDACRCFGDYLRERFPHPGDDDAA
jgi:acetoin utilization protein AcuB